MTALDVDDPMHHASPAAAERRARETEERQKRAEREANAPKIPGTDKQVDHMVYPGGIMTDAEIVAEGGTITGSVSPELIEPDAPVASVLQSPQDRAYMRLELLRLAHGHHLEAHQIVERAKTLEAYVFGDQAADKP